MYDNQSNQNYYAYNPQQQQQQQQYYNPQQQTFDTDNYAKKGNDFGNGELEFADSFVRGGFIKKVYGLLTFELAVLLSMIALGLYTGMMNWLVYVESGSIYICNFYGGVGYCAQEYAYWLQPTWLFYTSFFISIILQMVLFCGGNIARKTPINYIVLILYLIFFGFMMSTFCIWIAAYYGAGIIWEAWGITFGLVFFLTAYACKTSSDFSFKIGAIIILSQAILFTCIWIIIWPSYFGYTLICALIIILYGFYLIWETQLIMGKGKLKLSIDEYVIGSLLLFGTIIQLFIRIVEILAIARGR